MPEENRAALALAFDEIFLVPADMTKRFKVSETALARGRVKGDGPPFLKDGARYLYPLSLALEHYAQKLVTSINELPPGSITAAPESLTRARAKAHGPAARAKAQATRAETLAKRKASG